MRIPGVTFHAYAPASGSRPAAAASAQDEYLQTMKQLAERTGNKAALEKILAAQRQAEARRNRKAPAMDEGMRTRVAAFLQGQGPVPAGFDAQHAGFLDAMASLNRRGVVFVDARMQPLDAVDAFAGLVTRPDERDPAQQVYYKSYGSQTITIGGVPTTMSGVSTATLRAEYLAALDHYLEHAGHGHVLMQAEDKPYDSAASFMREHAEDYAKFEPRVPYDGKFVTVADFERLEHERRQGEVERLAGEGRGPAPKVVDLGSEISIGGVVLRKREGGA